jgi:hypothetical protein
MSQCCCCGVEALAPESAALQPRMSCWQPACWLSSTRRRSSAHHHSSRQSPCQPWLPHLQPTRTVRIEGRERSVAIGFAAPVPSLRPGTSALRQGRGQVCPSLRLPLGSASRAFLGLVLNLRKEASVSPP